MILIYWGKLAITRKPRNGTLMPRKKVCERTNCEVISISRWQVKYFLNIQYCTCEGRLILFKSSGFHAILEHKCANSIIISHFNIRMLLLKIYSKAHSLRNIFQRKSHRGNRPNSFTDLFCLVKTLIKHPARAGVVVWNVPAESNARGARDVREASSVKPQEAIDVARAFRPWRQKPYIIQCLPVGFILF